MDICITDSLFCTKKLTQKCKSTIYQYFLKEKNRNTILSHLCVKSKET